MNVNAKSTSFLIVGAGDILDDRFIRQWISEEGNPFVICADGGYTHCQQMGIKADLAVGDFDSLKEPIPEEIPRITLSPEKDYTDATLAMEKAIDLGARKILLTGMLGGRLDHTLANIGNLIYCTKRKIETIITDGKTHIYALDAESGKKEITISSIPGYYFSLLSFSENSKNVTIKGGKYPLNNYALKPEIPRAISNEFIDKPVTISITAGTIAIICTPIV